MGSAGSPISWAPYDGSYRDCSQKLCSSYCLQRCINILPPPSLEDPSGGDDSAPNFSPLIISIIAILTSALLFLTFYTIFAKFCRRRSRGRTADIEANRDGAPPPPAVSSAAGRPGEAAAVSKTVKVFKYKRGEGGTVQDTECSVCLAEFQDDESLRLLPKCSHAFHLHCIDTWLKSQPNCPICRANVAVDPNNSS